MIVLVVAITEFLVCLLLPYIRNTFIRKIYATSWGFIVGFYAYGATFWLYLAFVFLGYLMMVLLPRPSKLMIIIGFLYLQFTNFYFFF